MNLLAELGIHAQPKTQSAQCVVHGEFVARCFIGNAWSRCPKCSAEATERELAKQLGAERVQQRQAWQRQVGEAGIPERFRSRSLQSFIATTPSQQRALAFATAYADGFDEVRKTGRSAVFIGKPGTGKTHLAAGIALRIMQRDQRTVWFTSVLRAVRRIKDSWRKNSVETESQAIAALVFPDLLILDEVGQQFGSETERLMLFDVLNERYEQRKPVLLLSNLPLEDYTMYGKTQPGLKAFLGERVMDRLREDEGEFVIFDGESWRGRG